MPLHLQIPPKIKNLFAKLACILVFTLGFTTVSRPPQQVSAPGNVRTPFYERTYPWVDSLMETMTVEEKIGQLFMVAAYSNNNASNEAEIEKLIKNYHIGGLICMQGGPVRQVRLLNNFQSISEIPLLVGMDAEWGPAMRLDSVIDFQRQLTMGALRDDSLIYEFGSTVAGQLKRLGVQLDFAPVIDINNNEQNPVIGDRSFGEDKFNVTLKGLMYMNGLQDHGILACGKHFPGHGDVTSDSHLTLPKVDKSYSQLDSLEFFPFRILMHEGLGSVMLAHLYLPQIDSTLNQASSLSPKIGTGILRDSLRFRGLVFSDALNMQGVSSFYPPGTLELKAFEAGNDVLLFSQDVPLAFATIKRALDEGVISTERLDASVRRILQAKAFTGLNHYHPVNATNLLADLNTTAASVLKRKITAGSITLAFAEDSLLPLKRPDTMHIATLSIGGGSAAEFQSMASKYSSVQNFQISKSASPAAFQAMLGKLGSYDLVLVGVQDLSRQPSKDFGVTDNAVDFVRDLAAKTRVAVMIFGSPYAIGDFTGAQYGIVAYDNDRYTQQAAVMAVFGALPFEGSMPVSAGRLARGSGIVTGSLERLRFGIPEDENMDGAMLEKKIDSIVHVCIADRCAPGCQVLVARNGDVVFDKAFGYFTYDGKRAVHLTDLYDLASCTKICATTPALMKMYEDSLLDMQKEVGDYLPDTRGSEIEHLKISDVMTHQSGLVAWIPFYKKTLNPDGSLNALYYNQSKIPGFSVQVADGIYMRDDYRDSIWEQIKYHPLGTKDKYVYSDLGMYIARRIFEKISRLPIDTYMEQNFFLPLGMQTTCYKPLERFPRSDIAPTEDDNYFRYQLIQGYVHDMGAAMMGGVEGHAGLFSDADDLAVLFQMLLNGGYYGGQRYFNPETIALWTSKQSDISRRGLGFDKAETDPRKESPCSSFASPQTYGHQGFTGTCIWVDPACGLIYIFLSNRVYPSAEHNKLASEGIRNKIMDAIYQSMHSRPAVDTTASNISQ